MIILNSLSLNCLLSVFVLKQLVAEGGAQSPDVTDPCANADTQRHVGDIAYFPSIEALSGRSDGESEYEDSNDRAKRGATSSQSLLWPGGIIDYTFSSQFSETERMQVFEAMRHWENHTCLRFRARTYQENYVNFIKSSGCCSYVGNLGLGEQGLSLGGNCMKFEIILHEIGHAIGFWHEHTRPDRDDYIDVLYSNILPNYLKNFEKLNPDITDDFGVGYDYNSIMHYNYDYFARLSGTTTLNAKAGGIPLGQAVQLSPSDILQSNLLYNCDDLVPPRSTLPDALQETPQTLPFSCGSILSTPTNSFSQFSNVTGSNVTDCAWLIQPSGRFRITIELRNILMDDSNNCRNAYIAVHQGVDETGRLIARICRSYSRYIRHLQIYDNSFIRFHSQGPSASTRGFVVDYRLNDVDECISFARCSQYCRNTYGGYTCYCRNGFYLSGDGRTCFDINECALHNGGCSETCTNNGGSYYCSCSTPSYVLHSDHKTCRRSGATCSINNGQCMHKCSEMSTSRVCSCHEGYQLEPDGRTCFDINECLYSACQAECVNTPGSFFCRCKAGFHLKSDNRTCAPDRVCHINNGECNQKCRSLGSDIGASCYCLKGYRLGQDGKTCEDINECEERRHLCHHTCINTNGSYVCDCREGYELSSNEQGCENINECRKGISECQFSDYCYDVPGSYTCSCPRGFSLAPDGHSCLDKDECAYSHYYYCSHNCVNTPGSFECTCRDGYVLQGGWYCYDINECLSSHQCNLSSGASCRNLEGSYSCICPVGFRLDASGWKCVDIDECHENLHYCGPRRYCVNRMGYYSCFSTPAPTEAQIIETQTASSSLPTATTQGVDKTTASNSLSEASPIEFVTTNVNVKQTSSVYISSENETTVTSETNPPEGSTPSTDSSLSSRSQHFSSSTSKEQIEFTNEYIATEDQFETTSEHSLAEVTSSTASELKFTDQIHDILTTMFSEPMTTMQPTTQSPTTVSPTLPRICGGDISEYSGTIASNNWPRTYPINMDCEWTLRTPASNQVLKLSFQTSAYGIASNMPRCTKDWVRITSHGSNETWGPFCGFGIPSNITIKTDEVVIRFHAGPKHGSARKGFSIIYEVWDTCIQLPPPLSPEGTFTCNAVVGLNQKFGPPDFPGFITSRTATKCLWVVISRYHAKLKFLYFDIPESNGCKEGNVKLYNDYYRHDRSLIATLCGNLTEEYRTVNITTSYYSIELNLGSVYGMYRGLHAIIQNLN